MATASNDYNGTVGTAPGAITGSWSWAGTTLDPAGSVTLQSTQTVSGATSARADSTTKDWTEYDTYLFDHFDLFTRQYLYLTAAPTNGFCVSRWWTDGYTQHITCGITTDLRIFTNRGSGPQTEVYGSGIEAYSAASVVPLNEWIRVETYIGPTAASINIYTGAGLHTTSPSAGRSINYTVPASAELEAVGLVSVNSSASTRTFISSSNHIYVDSRAVDSVTSPGPVPTIKTAAAALSATGSATASAGSVAASAAALSATGSLTAAADVAIPPVAGAAALTATGSMSSSAAYGYTVTVSLAGAGSLTADAEVSEVVTSAAALAGVGSLSAGAYLDSEVAPGYLFGSVAPNPVTGG